MEGRLLGRIADVLLPPVCAGCGLPGAPVCAACLAGLAPLGPPGCARCGCPQALAVGRCPECRPAIVRAAQAARYDARAALVVGALKDAARRDVAPPLARLIAARCAPPPPGAVLVPVPLGRRRQLERGFNQSALIARELAVLWGAPLRPDLLRRVREEPPQRGSGRTARARQAAGAFAVVPGSPVPERAWLVDDVLTTGATLGACAAALRGAGVREVGAVAVARALRG